MYIWVVYPRDSGRAVITVTGLAEDETRARSLVEGILTISDQHTLGLVIDPFFDHSICHRRDDGYAWARHSPA